MTHSHSPITTQLAASVISHPVTPGTYGLTFVGSGISGAFGPNRLNKVGTAQWLVISALADGRLILAIYRAARSTRDDELVCVGHDGKDRVRTVTTAMDLSRMSQKLSPAITPTVAIHVERLLEAMQTRVAQRPQNGRESEPALPHCYGSFTDVPMTPDLITRGRRIRPGAQLDSMRAPATGILEPGAHHVLPGFSPIIVREDGTGTLHHLQIPEVGVHFHIPEDFRVEKGQLLASPAGDTPIAILANLAWLEYQMFHNDRFYATRGLGRLALAAGKTPVDVVEDISSILGENIWNPAEKCLASSDPLRAMRGELGAWAPMATDEDLVKGLAAPGAPLFASEMPKIYVGAFDGPEAFRFRFDGGYADLSAVPRAWEPSLGGPFFGGEKRPMRRNRDRRHERHGDGQPAVAMTSPAVQQALHAAVERHDEAAAAILPSAISAAAGALVERVESSMERANSRVSEGAYGTPADVSSLLDPMLQEEQAQNEAFEAETKNIMAFVAGSKVS